MVFGLFSKEKSLQKTIEKATNKLSQQPDRWAALEKLRDDGTDEALFGLCKRFGITSNKGVEDEQEKHWVVNTLVEKGTVSLPPLVRYMKGADQLGFPLRVLERTKAPLGARTTDVANMLSGPLSDSFRVADGVVKKR